MRALSSGEKSGRSEAEGLLRMRASSVARSITMRRTSKTTASPRPLGITMRKKVNVVGATTRSSGRWTRWKEGRRGVVLTDASSSGAIEAPPSGWVQRYAHRQSLGLGDQTLPGGLHALRLCKMPHLPLGEQQVVSILLDRKRERQNIHKRWPVAMHELSPQMDLGGRWNSAHARGRLPRG